MCLVCLVMLCWRYNVMKYGLLFHSFKIFQITSVIASYFILMLQFHMSTETSCRNDTRASGWMFNGTNYSNENHKSYNCLDFSLIKKQFYKLLNIKNKYCVLCLFECHGINLWLNQKSMDFNSMNLSFLDSNLPYSDQTKLATEQYAIHFLRIALPKICICSTSEQLGYCCTI